MSDNAPALCRTEASDADVHAHNLRNWQQQYDQLSDGRFYGRIDELAFEQLQIFCEYTSQALLQQCNVWPDSVWLGFAANDSECRINGERVAADQIMVRPGHCDFELTTPAEFDIYGVVISQPALLQCADTLGIELDARAWLQPRKQWQLQQLNALRYMVQRWLTPMHTGVGGRLQQELLFTTVLEVLQQPSVREQRRSSYGRRRAVVERIQAYVEAHPHAPITITELCQLTHVSRRTLQYSFEAVLNMSPQRYVRITRLNGVRRQLLLASADEGLLISRVAAEWGFWHAGQFGHDYKQLFGERPSDTLQRCV
ncbi:AraC family transcriptional regulator [Bacterioplanes sanyensis]|uniref:AraC family transcriptional regulator n=1 Tax=Bacterioplanes sanyensis TaxID=1249553 RepID=A0A222FEU2_9GAMM|nr:helix-turn-helix domain-containing protein [Bacterioplanes sanyensis]ASP37528.1 AraC family transcriptional regulator [Bacterioplanes sanyensis]